MALVGSRELRSVKACRQELERRFGHTRFRGVQEEALQSIMNAVDTMVIMPTGGGKTMCFVLPALVQPGVAIVVSPLLALMQDQVAALHRHSVRCAALSSLQSSKEKADIIKEARLGVDGSPDALQLLFVTPEYITSEDGQAALGDVFKTRLISLLAVDEAHCISSWGHDFRPAYRKLGMVRDRLLASGPACVPTFPVVALTATATERVEADIVRLLRFRHNHRVARASFNRPNLAYRAEFIAPGRAGLSLHEQKVERILGVLPPAAQVRCQGPRGTGACAQGPAGAAIVYTLRRADAEAVAASLERRGVRLVAPYHAGLPMRRREEVVAGFASGAVRVVVATVAFGMGIDVAAVRAVVHYTVPKSLEAFYQESGRAGRDGLPATSLVLVSAEDISLLRFLANRADTASAGREQRKGSEGAGLRHNARSSHLAQLRAVEGFVLGAVSPAASIGSTEACSGLRCFRQALLEHFGELGGACEMVHRCDQACDVCSLGSAAVKAKALEMMSSAASRDSTGARRGLGTSVSALPQQHLLDADSWRADAAFFAADDGDRGDAEPYDAGKAKRRRSFLEEQAEAMRNASLRTRVAQADASALHMEAQGARAAKAIGQAERSRACSRITSALCTGKGALSAAVAQRLAAAVDEWAAGNCASQQEYNHTMRALLSSKLGGPRVLQEFIISKGICTDIA